MPELREELIEGGFLSLGDDLDAAVLSVANIALQVQAPGRRSGKEAIADALHLAVYAGFQSFVFQSYSPRERAIQEKDYSTSREQAQRY